MKQFHKIWGDILKKRHDDMNKVQGGVILMDYWLKIIDENGDTVTINYGDKQASRGATMAGLGQTNVVIEVWDVDEKGRRWDKEL